MCCRQSNNCCCRSESFAFFWRHYGVLLSICCSAAHVAVAILDFLLRCADVSCVLDELKFGIFLIKNKKVTIPQPILPNFCKTWQIVKRLD
jgi:hypothetical protein